jgi:hypothetical protein
VHFLVSYTTLGSYARVWPYAGKETRSGVHRGRIRRREHAPAAFGSGRAAHTIAAEPCDT